MNYTIKLESNIVILDCNIDFDFEDGIEVLNNFLNNSKYPSSSSLLILDPGSSFNPTMEDTRKIASLFTDLLEKSFLRIGLVVSKMVHFGIGRMTESLADPVKGRFKVFRSEKEAREWLTETDI
jgi:hypothetical protein